MNSRVQSYLIFPHISLESSDDKALFSLPLKKKKKKKGKERNKETLSTKGAAEKTQREARLFQKLFLWENSTFTRQEKIDARRRLQRQRLGFHLSERIIRFGDGRKIRA